MGRALEWQHHLFAAGAYQAAAEIVMAVWDVLARWGERDRAKALLRGSIETLEGFSKAVAQGNLATLLKDEGKLDEALATYQAVYRTFEALGETQNVATVLELQGTVLQQMGEYDKAIALQEKSLKLKQEIGHEEGQAISLHQLSILYHIKGDTATALARSQEAEKLARKVSNEALVATTLHQQGIIHNELASAAQSEAEREAGRRAAFDRFRGSLEINQRIGNEGDAASTLGELGKMLRDAGQLREAIAAFGEALEIFTKLGNLAKMGIVLEHLGIIHEQQEQYAAALEKYEQALSILERVGAVREAENNRRHIARVRGKLGR
jgi:tetratricopeptide (TPR) repeat protein